VRYGANHASRRHRTTSEHLLEILPRWLLSMTSFVGAPYPDVTHEMDRQPKADGRHTHHDEAGWRGYLPHVIHDMDRRGPRLSLPRLWLNSVIDTGFAGNTAELSVYTSYRNTWSALVAVIPPCCSLMKYRPGTMLSKRHCRNCRPTCSSPLTRTSMTRPSTSWTVR